MQVVADGLLADVDILLLLFSDALYNGPVVQNFNQMMVILSFKPCQQLRLYHCERWLHYNEIDSA